MKKAAYFIVLLALAASVVSCKKSDDKPYIIIRDASGEVITSDANIPVALNSTVRISSEIGYERRDGNNVDYDWKTDGGPYTQYSALDGLNITTLGSYNNLSIEKATLDVTFSDEEMAQGSLVSVRVSDQKGMSRTVTFEVE